MKIYHTLSQVEGIPGPCAVALGYFDGVHLGHQKVLHAALSSSLTPCIFTFQRLDKKGESVLSREAKHEIFREAGFQAVLSLDFSEVKALSPERFIHEILIEKMGARTVCCGDNFRFGRDAAGNLDFLRRECAEAGVSVLAAGQVTCSGEIVSSTAIRREISAGNMESVSRMLGRPYSVDFEVVHGNELGRQLDFPTINQVYPEGFCIPAFGVYASVAKIGEKYLPAVTNVGVKPTVGSDCVLAETNIAGCNEQLYGQRVPVFFLRHLRGEVRFPSLQHLKEQMSRDREQAVEISLDTIGRGEGFFRVFPERDAVN